MKRKLILTVFYILALVAGAEAQTLRGSVTDAATGEPIAGAAIQLKGNHTGTVTDAGGSYLISSIQPGRYTVEASFLGYSPMLYREILIAGQKEVILNFSLEENATELDEVTVRPRVNKESAVNSMSLTGTRMLSMEEASRYAGGYSDPARLLTAFAGVAGSPDNNGVSVHGNAPQSLSWRLEGVEINSPNHFTDAFNMGTGVVGALNSKVLGNSDFHSGAFTAEYANALSGVMDMRMREGNDRRYEHAAQVGTLGAELASEGPISRKAGSSYLVNYRYSFTTLARDLGLLALDGDQADYQDLSFKLNFPTRRAGTFSLFGLALKDKYWVDLEAPSRWESYYDQEYTENRQTMAVGGMNHVLHFGKGWNWKTTVAASCFTNDTDQHYYQPATDGTDRPGGRSPYLRMRQDNWQITAVTSLQRRFGERFTAKAGLTYTARFFDLTLQVADKIFTPLPSSPVYQADSHTTLWNAYIANSWKMSSQLTFNFGLTTQRFQLNGEQTWEPRAALQWSPDLSNTFSLGYGLHSKMEKMDVYFYKDPEQGDANRALKLSKAHHLLLSFLHRFSDHLNLRIETYYQQLYDLPVGLTGSYCTLNRRDFYVDCPLVSRGRGRNYGIDLTLERFMEHGYYYMVNGSLYKAEYRAADGIWRNTRYNRTYLLKLMGGKEWIIGAKKKNVLSVNGKFTLQGGMHHTPTDLEASRLLYEEGSPDVAYREEEAFSKQYKPMGIVDFTVSYRISGRHADHTFAIEALNVLGKKTPYIDLYNYRKGQMGTYMNGVAFPNIYYCISF